MRLVFLFLSKLINNVFDSAKGRKKFYSIWKYLYGISVQGMGRMQGLDVDESGEVNAVETMLKLGQNPFVLFDVGANKGQYLSMVVNRLRGRGQAEIHVFEPFPSNCLFLKNKFSSNNNIQFYINDLAIGRVTGKVNFYTDDDGSDIASTFNLKVSARPFNEKEQIQVDMKTLDNYLNEHSVHSIDLLKIDVEGAEYDVLLGAKNAIAGHRIKNIQFEFGTANITSRIFFHDFWELLSVKYHFYQILKDGLIPIRQYSTDLELFITTNYFLTLKKGDT